MIKYALRHTQKHHTNARTVYTKENNKRYTQRGQTKARANAITIVKWKNEQQKNDKAGISLSKSAYGMLNNNKKENKQSKLTHSFIHTHTHRELSFVYAKTHTLSAVAYKK